MNQEDQYLAKLLTELPTKPPSEDFAERIISNAFSHENERFSSNDIKNTYFENNQQGESLFLQWASTLLLPKPAYTLIIALLAGLVMGWEIPLYVNNDPDHTQLQTVSGDDELADFLYAQVSIL